jgi:hypothetical protein
MRHLLRLHLHAAAEIRRWTDCGRSDGRMVSCNSVTVISCGTSQQTNEPTHSSLVSRSTRLHFGDLTCKFTHSWSMRKSSQQNSYWPSVIAEFDLEKTAHGKSQCKGWPNIWFFRKQAESVCEQIYKIVGDMNFEPFVLLRD